MLERYVGDFKRDSIATSFSTAKSFLSALIGIAIDEGAIGGIEDPITEYLPELLERDWRFGDITIVRHGEQYGQPMMRWLGLLLQVSDSVGA